MTPEELAEAAADLLARARKAQNLPDDWQAPPAVIAKVITLARAGRDEPDAAA
jgi:hypothetical protein